MSKKKTLLKRLMVISLFLTPLFAGDGSNYEKLIWAVIVSIGGLTLSAMAGAIAQSNAIKAAFEGISRNPGSAGSIRALFLLGLAFIESLVIYVLFINIVIYFIRWKDLIAP
ncbi:MAG: ATP synthase F0 subunit C [Candidatus Aminicenantia bacterium]